MVKKEFVKAVAEKSGVTHKIAEAVINGFQDVVIEELNSGGSIKLVGFGKFDLLEYRARIGHNPKTMEPIPIPAKKRPRFKFGTEFQNIIS